MMNFCELFKMFIINVDKTLILQA